MQRGTRREGKPVEVLSSESSPEIIEAIAVTVAVRDGTKKDIVVAKFRCL